MITESWWEHGGVSFDEYENAGWDADRLAEECARLRAVAAALAEALREWVEYGGDETKSRAALAQFDGSGCASDS